MGGKTKESWKGRGTVSQDSLIKLKPGWRKAEPTFCFLNCFVGNPSRSLPRFSHRAPLENTNRRPEKHLTNPSPATIRCSWSTHYHMWMKFTHKSTFGAPLLDWTLLLYPDRLYEGGGIICYRLPRLWNRDQKSAAPPQKLNIWILQSPLMSHGWQLSLCYFWKHVPFIIKRLPFTYYCELIDGLRPCCLHALHQATEVTSPSVNKHESLFFLPSQTKPFLCLSVQCFIFLHRHEAKTLKTSTFRKATK